MSQCVQSLQPEFGKLFWIGPNPKLIATSLTFQSGLACICVTYCGILYHVHCVPMIAHIDRSAFCLEKTDDMQFNSSS